MNYFPLNATSAENKKEAFHKMVVSYGSELDAHQSRSTPHEIFRKWAESMINIQGDRDRHLELCCVGSAPIGFLYGKIDHSWHKGYVKDGYGYIMEFYVLPEYRRRGYGTEMYAHLENLLKRDGAARLYLTADPVTGKPFWESQGFVRTGETSPENHQDIFEKAVPDSGNDTVISHYDALIDEGNDPVHDPQPLQAYMDKWDGQAFLDSLELDKEKSVLEIGVGTGRLAVRVAPLCSSFCGIDLSPKTVEQARKNLSDYANVTLLCGDFLTYPFDFTFDVVYSSLTFLHMQDKQKAIRKAADLVKDGGRFVLSIEKSQSDVIDMGTRRVKIYPDDPVNTAKMLQAAGLKIETQYETEFAVIFNAIKEPQKSR